MSQAAYQKPEEPADFAQHYFEKIRSGFHVVGADYPSYISACSYNRRSFVHCLMKAFSGFSGSTEFTAFEFFHLIELLSPSFPRSLVIDAVHAARPSIPFSDIDNVKLSFKELSFTVYVFILFGTVYLLYTLYIPLYTLIHPYTRPMHTPIHPYTRPIYTPYTRPIYTPYTRPIHPYTPLYTPTPIHAVCTPIRALYTPIHTLIHTL